MKLLLPVIPALLLSCHETPAQAVTQAIDLTNAVCTVAQDVPNPDPSIVTLICTIAEGVEETVSVVVGELSADAGADAGGALPPVPAIAKVRLRQVRVEMPAASAPAFLASHRTRTADAGK